MNLYSQVIPAMQKEGAKQLDEIPSAPPNPVATKDESKQVN
jgi:hypothetical protein